MVTATTDKVEQRSSPSQEEILVEHLDFRELAAYVRGFQSYRGAVILHANSDLLGRPSWGSSVTSDSIYIIERDTTQPRIGALSDTVEHESRTIEMNWLSSQSDLRKRLAGQWVAVERERLVAHGHRLAEVLEQSRIAGVQHPFIICLPETDDEEIAVIA